MLQRLSAAPGEAQGEHRGKVLGPLTAPNAICTDALSSTVNLNVDLDVMLAVLAQPLTAALRARLPGYAAVTPDTIQRRFLETPGQILTDAKTGTVRLERRAFSPVLRKADLPADTAVPWWGGKTIRYEIT